MLEIFKVPETDAVRVPVAELRRVVTSIFERMDEPPEDAALAADVLVSADLRGVDSHGVSNMLRSYVNGYREGRIKARSQWQVVQERAATATIDCDRGLGTIVAPKAMAIAIDKARQTGVGMVSMRNGNHLGMASYHAMLALPHDMVGVCMTAVGPQVLPTFGAEPRIGTNPIAVAVPGRHMHPLVLDIATSVVAANKLALARRLGAAVPGNFVARPDGSIIAEEGPLPAEYQLLTFGGTRELGSHKGYGLALVVDVLCSLFGGTTPAGTGGRGRANHYVAAYNVDAFTDVEEFKDRVDEWLRTLEATKPAPGHERVLTPGQLEAEEEAERSVKGIPLHKEVVQWLEEIGKELAIPVPL